MTSPVAASALHSSSLASLNAESRRQIIQSLTEEQAAGLLYDWPFWAREKQVPPPGLWQVWLVLAGRGFGKTRTGGEWVREQVEKRGRRRLALVAPTAADARDVMVEGESGILALSPPWFRPEYEPSKRRLTWPNGAVATLYTAEKPDQLRGPQHDAAWCDELASWQYPETWDMLLFGLRLGDNPQAVVTTTPRPTKEIKELLRDPTCAVTRGSTFENAANLAPSFFTKIVKRYEGTRLGRQELYAEVLTDTPGALWNMELLDLLRVTAHPGLIRVVVAIDPAATSTEDADETGIVVAGLGMDGHGYVLADGSLRGSPAEWAQTAVDAFDHYEADRIIAEINNGGEMVGYTIATVRPNASFKAVHASRGKQTRAEPIAALYEQGRMHHVGSFPQLEDQMTTWVPGMSSPDRMDALVWAFTELFLEGQDEEELYVYDDRVSISRF